MLPFYWPVALPNKAAWRLVSFTEFHADEEVDGPFRYWFGTYHSFKDEPVVATSKCWNRLCRIKSVCCLALIMLVVTSGLRACPFCLSPPMTLVEEINTSDMVVIVELLRFEVIRTDKHVIPQSTVRIREFLQGADLAAKHGRLQTGQAFVVRQEVAGAPGDLFLLFGTLPNDSSSTGSTFTSNESGESNAVEEGRVVPAVMKSEENAAKRIQRTSLMIPELILWTSTTPVSQEAIRYIKDAPAPSLAQSQRLLYYLGFLEHPDPLLSIDSWAEFANATYDDVKGVRNEMPREKLRQWIADPMMTPERLGLYGMMLGLCGNEADAEFLQDQIGLVPPSGKDETQFFRYGTDGLMGGYLLLTGEKGVEFLERTRLKPDVPTDSIHAAVQAMQFVYSYESSLIPEARLKLAMRKLLSNDDLRILTITNLARWKDWECWPELERMFNEECDNDRSTQKTIVQFAEECRKARAADGQTPKVANAADEFLKRAEVEHPELFTSTNNAEFQSP